MSLGMRRACRRGLCRSAWQWPQAFPKPSSRKALVLRLCLPLPTLPRRQSIYHGCPDGDRDPGTSRSHPVMSPHPPSKALTAGQA